MPPGETPPGEDSTGGAVSGDDQPNAEPRKPNRTPMVITLIAVAMAVLLVAGFLLADALMRTI